MKWTKKSILFFLLFLIIDSSIAKLSISNINNPIIKKSKIKLKIHNDIKNTINKIGHNLSKNELNILISELHHLQHPELILALAKVESNFNTKAYSKNNHGIMQINNINIIQLKKQKIIRTKKDLYNIKLSIKSADYLLSQHKSLKQKIIKYKGKYNKQYYNKVIKYMTIFTKIFKEGEIKSIA